MRINPDFDTVTINKDELFCEADTYNRDKVYVTAYYEDDVRTDIIVIGEGGEHVNATTEVSMSHNDSAKLDSLFRSKKKTKIRVTPSFFVGLIFVGAGIAKVLFL